MLLCGTATTTTITTTRRETRTRRRRSTERRRCARRSPRCFGSRYFFRASSRSGTRPRARSSRRRGKSPLASRASTASAIPTRLCHPRSPRASPSASEPPRCTPILEATSFPATPSCVPTSSSSSNDNSPRRVAATPRPRLDHRGTHLRGSYSSTPAAHKIAFVSIFQVVYPRRHPRVAPCRGAPHRAPANLSPRLGVTASDRYRADVSTATLARDIPARWVYVDHAMMAS